MSHCLLQSTGRLVSTDRASLGTSQCRQRSLVLCRATEGNLPRSEGKPLFQLDNRQHLNMADIMDAYEVCSLIPDPSERHQCYSVFGLDAKRMSAYYETVVQLEHQLSADLESPATSSVPASWQRSQQTPLHHQHPTFITGNAPPPPAAAAAVAVAMMYIAAQHLAFF